MAVMSGAEFAAKWANRLSNSTTEMLKGVNAVSTSPAQAAVAKKAKLIANWNASINDGSWERAMNKISVEDWRSAMINKGVPRVASGAQEAAAKMAAFGDRLLAYQNAGLPTIYKMPDTSLADSKNRAVAWIEYMSKMPKG